MTLEVPIRYTIHPSKWVSESIIEIAKVADDRGDGTAFRHALQEFRRRLQIYPQFGDPIIDLINEEGQVRIGIIPPISIRYTVLESHRIVFLANRPILLRMATE